MASFKVFLAALAFFVASASAQGSFALRHSFRPAFPNKKIHHWEAGAGAYINDTYVRITPARQSRTGFLWNHVPSTMVDWEAELEFRITGRPDFGADGLALWYTQTPDMIGGVYGSADYWVGMGVFFDTFNNDEDGDSPLISAVVNDGTQRYNQAEDGKGQTLGSCSRNYRNKQFTTFAKITYQYRRLTIAIALTGSTRTENSPLSHVVDTSKLQYENCFAVDNVVLGVDKYFGLTAHTGDVADNHDVYSFVVRDLSPTNTDLREVRDNYHRVLQEEQSKPNHQQMDKEDFQHSVITLLNQIQGAQNLLEISQIAIGDHLNNQVDAMMDIADASTSSGGGKQDFVSMISDVARKQSQLTSAVEKISMKVNKMADNLEAIKQKQLSIPSGTGKAKPSSIDDGASQLKKQMKTMQDTVMREIRTIQTKVTMFTSQSVQDSVDSGSWMTTLLLLFCALGVVGIALYLNKQRQNQRFKIV